MLVKTNDYLGTNVDKKISYYYHIGVFVLGLTLITLMMFV